jgi:hypothetical protein
MARLFALDQNFPLPIVDSLHEWLAADADLIPIADVHAGMATRIGKCCSRFTLRIGAGMA